ncbi:hypothetical protein [Streptomyces sp. SAJ15]|uniref:hypothetical protein n=1 Tax=Streptomyces sp. SAJ15 TaxID=2011095 RepID=UPI0011861F91|nr:hypothetical protein [Streptomyces sp. SAJ15]TVL89794.1 hypothetical protein CD790_25700 [Streptomyces sp. SAJ15]
MTMTHFTAWLTTDRTCLEDDQCDVTVLADKIAGYEFDSNGFETNTPVWTSVGDPLWYAKTSHTADEDDDQSALEEAEELLEKAGWRLVGGWEAVTTGCTATVERVADELAIA